MSPVGESSVVVEQEPLDVFSDIMNGVFMRMEIAQMDVILSALFNLDNLGLNGLAITL